MYRQTDTWEVRWEKVITILVEDRKEGKGRKITVVATVGSTAVIFGITPLSRNGERPSSSCRFWSCGPLDVLVTPPGLSPSVGSPVK